MQIRAAVLEETGGALTVQELELAPPGPLVRPLRGLPPGLHVAVLHRLAGEGGGLYRTATCRSTASSLTASRSTRSSMLST